MKKLWKYGLGLSLGLLVSSARAGDVPGQFPALAAASRSQPADTVAPPAATLDRPVIAGARPASHAPGVNPGPSASSQAPPGATYKPLPEAAASPVIAGSSSPLPLRDPYLRPTSYDGGQALVLPESVTRVQGTEVPRPMPSGPLFKEEPGSVKGPGKDGPALINRVEPEPLPPPRSLLNSNPEIPPSQAVPGPTPTPLIVPVPSSAPDSSVTPGAVLSAGCGISADSCGVGCGTECGPLHCDAGGACGCPRHNFYVSGEYLLWRVPGQKIPPLLTSGSTSDAVPGALGQPNTNVLVGNRLDDQTLQGGRITAGWWFGCDHCFALEGSVLWLGQSSQHTQISSGGVPLLARPFFNPASGAEDAELVAASTPVNVVVDNNGTPTSVPLVVNTLAGAAAIDSFSRMWGSEVNFRTEVCCGDWYHVDLLTGFRFLQLDEGLTVHESLTSLAQQTVLGIPVNPGDGFAIFDKFTTRNYFYGGQVGAETEFRYNGWFLDLKGKLALGATNQIVTIEGATTSILAGGGSQTSQGGLLAQTTNIGRHNRTVFAAVPELNMTVGYQLTEHLRAYVGYNVIYWGNVARPGQQIDRVVNPALLPPSTGGGVQRPAFVFHGSDFWAQGVTLGLELRY